MASFAAPITSGMPCICGAPAESRVEGGELDALSGRILGRTWMVSTAFSGPVPISLALLACPDDDDDDDDAMAEGLASCTHRRR